MKHESTNAKRAKQAIKEQIEVEFQIPLPEWLVEGATFGKMRYLQMILEAAHQRYMSEKGNVPTRDPRVEQIP